MSDLGIVIVNYRTADLVAGCLRSLAREIAPLKSARVVIVDNDSRDGSADRITNVIETDGFGRWAELVESRSNRGFSAGNNVGISRLLGSRDPPEWLLLLNPDTLVRPGALAALLQRAAAEQRAGIVGSALEGPDGAPQAAAFPFPSIVREVERGLRLGLFSRLLAPQPRPTANAPRRVDWVSGASLLVRRAVLEEVGLLDEGFFLYYEEVDLCLRAARAGWECWHEPSSRVVHLEGRSTGVDPMDLSRRPPQCVFDSRRRYFVKNHGAIYAALADLGWVLGHLGWRLRMHVQRRPVDVAPGLLRDFVRQSSLFGGGVQ